MAKISLAALGVLLLVLGSAAAAGAGSPQAGARPIVIPAAMTRPRMRGTITPTT